MPAILGNLERVRALAVDGKTLLVGGVRAGANSQLSAFDVAANKPISSAEIAAHVLGIALAGEHTALACSDGTVRVFRAGSEARAIAAHTGACTAVAAAPDKDRVASVGADGVMRVWSAASGKKLHEWALSPQPLRAVAVDPSGEYIAAAGDDGIVRVITVANGAKREMPGHRGAVYALAFTPRDGRLLSAGEDSVLRLWYVTGAIEFEARGGDESGHAGPVHAVAFVPVPDKLADGSEPGDRFYSAGADGKVKAWRLDDRRKPRTLDLGSKPLYALIFAPAAANARNTLGALFAGGDARTVTRIALDPAGAPTDATITYGTGFDAIAQSLAGQRPAREAAVRTLASLDEPEALEQLEPVLARDRDAEVRTLAAKLLGERHRRAARAALRERLDDESSPVRRAALTSLRAIDGEESLAPLRAALASKRAETRLDAVRALVPLRAHSPLVPGLIAERLTDGDADVRLAALDALTAIHPADSAEPWRAAFEKGGADLRAEVLVRAAAQKRTREPAVASLVARALDDADAGVARTAFTVKVLERPALAKKLDATDDDFQRASTDVARRVAQRKQGDAGAKAPSDEAVTAARTELFGKSAADAPAEEDLEPLLTALACRTPATAIRGARGLANLGDTRALGALLQLSRESDPVLRREAARALQTLHDPRARKRLVWMFDDGDASVRAAALDAFGQLEAKGSLAVAESALRSAHEDIRVRGLDQLTGLSGKARNETAETLLGDALDDEAAKVRSEAFRTLWAWHDKDPQSAIDRALAARFPDLRLRAVGELKNQGKEGWAQERLQTAIGDRDANVAQAAYDAVVELRGKEQAPAHLAALGSVHASVRAAGARGARHAPLDAVRAPLTKLLHDDDLAARTAALESLDRLLPNEAGPHYAALQGTHLDLRVRAAELLAVRHDEQLIEPMRALLADKELFRIVPLPVLVPLRQRAASALATLGAPRTVKYFATELLKDDDVLVREHAARGLATAVRRGDEGNLLDALGHNDAWVRSWAADGLARLGDARALPVLTGNLRNEHLPIRLGAIVSFAALGPEGFGGMLQGLEDPSRDVQETVFAIVLARDLRAFRRGEPPELLTSALSSGRPEVRFAAARALELRAEPEAYMGHVIEVLTPVRPDKAGDMKDWPAEEARGRLFAGLADALGSDVPEQRYAAAQVLSLRTKPMEYFREAARVAKLRSVSNPWTPDTTPRAKEESDTKPVRGWLRRLFSGDASTGEKGAAAGEPSVPSGERQQLLRLAFGAYVGLLRQVVAGDDEGHRVRRDAVDRIVELGTVPAIGASAAIPAVVRALDDPHHLVRRAALAGLKKLYPAEPDVPLSLALASTSADVARAALDELAARGDSARPRVAAALNSPLPEVRRYAFELLEKLSPKGSLEPLLAALGSEHADLRLGVVERLASANDPRVSIALGRALESDHDDLRLRAAELLALRKDDRTVDVLAAFLRADDRTQAERARQSLARLGSTSAARALAARFEDAEPGERVHLAQSLGQTRNPDAIALLAARFDDEDATVRRAAFDAALAIAGTDPDPEKRDHALALRALRYAVAARDTSLRLAAAGELHRGDDPAAGELLLTLFSAREVEVRVAAVQRYADRVIEKNAPVAPLEEVLRAGARELVLASARGVAARGNPLALRPLLLVSRAGQPGEREIALLSLGTLGDARGLDELETIANGGTEEAPAEPSMQAAAVEALGRLAPKLADAEVRKRVIERVELASTEGRDDETKKGAIRGLRFIGGERARATLESIVADEQIGSSLRAVAAEQLGALGDVAAEGALARALRDDEWEVRTAARKALDKLFPKDRTRVEFLAVDSPHEDISEPATAYLATEGDPVTLVPRLATLQNASLRRRLRFGLARRGSLPVPQVLELLVHDSPAVRDEAAWLVGACCAPDPSGTPRALSSEERTALSRALTGAETRAAEKWRAAHGEAREAEATAWARALWAARVVGVREVLPRAAERLRAGDDGAPAQVRREAARVLEALGGANDAPAVSNALTDSDAGVRAAAATALAHLAPDRAAQTAVTVRPFDPVAFGPTAGANHAALLATDAGRRLLLPAALTRGDTAALLDLARNAKDTPTRLDAIDALGRTGGAEARSLLESISRDKKSGDLALRKAAYRALRRAQRKLAREKKYSEATS